MADHKYPELVFQKVHGPGLEPPRSFEDALRDLVRNSPYLGISLLLHGIVLVIMMSMTKTILPDDGGDTITASQEEIEVPLPPEPPEEEPEVEDIEEIVEEPVISEEVITDVTEVIDNLQNDLPFDNTGLNDVIGVGAGAGGGFGRGKVGQRGKRAGVPHLKAVDDALRWLKFHQSADGYWSCNEFDNECGQLGDDGPCSGRGRVTHDVGVSGLALLAFLGAGNTDKVGKYSDTVKAGLKYLVSNQDRTTGNYANPDVNSHTYDHMIATLAVTEAYALTKQHRFKKSAEKALEYMYSIRNPGGAWRYGDPGDPEMIAQPNDTSVTGWAVLVMTLAKEYDLPIDDQALTDSMLFIDEMTDPVTGRTGYFDRGGVSSRPAGLEQIWRYDQTESMTAVGVLCRIFANTELKNAFDDPLIKKGVEQILKLPILWSENDADVGRKDFYYWYYATYALYQVGGTSWKQWEKGIEQVADNQIKEGEMQGSWDPQVDPWSEEGGRVWSTAINALCLEVFYRYDTVIGSH